MDEFDLLVIERARPDDVDGIMEVERNCFGRTWTREQYLNELLGGGPAWPTVVRIEGRVVAFGTITCVGDQGYIPTFGVISTHRRCGIGSRLLAALLAHADRTGVAEVVLEVRIQNTAARAMYEKFGFRAVAIRRGYYTDPPDDALVMRWTRCGEQDPRPDC